MPPPTSQKQLKQFLGKVSFLCQFIPALAEITHSFRALLKGQTRFKWDVVHQDTFEEVKKALVAPSTMVAPTLEKPLILYLTSTPKSIGTLLIQEMEGQ